MLLCLSIDWLVHPDDSQSLRHCLVMVVENVGLIFPTVPLHEDVEVVVIGFSGKLLYFVVSFEDD